VMGQVKSKNNDKHSYWLCKCKCGNEIIVVGTSLTRGYTKSCGCLRKEVHTKDLTGQRFGKLTVLQKAIRPKYLKNRNAYWLCKCDCGKEKIINGISLTSGSTKSCGCIFKDEEYIFSNKGLFKNKYNTYDLSGEYGIGYTSKGEEFYFDLEDYEKIKDYCWCYSGKDKYVSNTRYKLRMHRLVMKCTDDNLVVDHINHITYDNRKKNLRICSNSQNGMNKKIIRNNQSGCNGVTFDKNSGQWRTRIGVDQKMINIGRFNNKKDAIYTRKQAEEKYFGEYSYDNSIQNSKECGLL